jgi:hypothetical protein
VYNKIVVSPVGTISPAALYQYSFGAVASSLQEEKNSTPSAKTVKTIKTDFFIIIPLFNKCKIS